MHRIESNSFLSNSDERSKVFWIQSIFFFVHVPVNKDPWNFRHGLGKSTPLRMKKRNVASCQLVQPNHRIDKTKSKDISVLTCQYSLH